MRGRIFPLAIISLFTTICFAALQSPLSTRGTFASASQQLQDRVQKQVPKACPVTKPPARPFVPPPPYGTDHGPDQFWYGTESLWTLLGIEGTWNIHDNVLESQGAYRTKLTYWRRGFDWRRELEPGLIVIAKRLDRQAPPVAADPAHAVYIAGPGMMTGIDIPSNGCWEITARYSGDSLSFVVSVEP
jgi:hypothetical protein